MEVFSILFVCTVFILIIVANFVNIYNKTKGWMSLLMVFTLLPVGSISVLVTFIISIPILWVYKKLLKAYLKIKHGSKFVCMADGGDVLYASMPKRDMTVCYLLILEVSEETPPHQVYETMKDTVSKHFLQNRNKFYKLNSTLHHFLGYSYMLKEDFTVEQCVRKLRVTEKQNKLSKDELMQLISDCQYEPMPKNDSILWDCSIGVQPVEWGDSTKPRMKHYPILFRTHHFIGDAFAFIQFLFGVVADKTDNPDVFSKVYLSKVQSPWWAVRLWRSAVLVLYYLIYSPSVLLQNFISVEKVNVLSTAKPTYLDILATQVDNGEYFKKIIRIRNGIKGMHFSSVLFTALSLSLQEHLRKNSFEYPESLILLVPSVPKSIYLRELPVGHLTSDDIVFKNSVTAFNMNLPIFPKNKLSLEERLQLTQREAGMIESPNKKVLDFGSCLGFQLLPSALIRFFWQVIPMTTCISILPGTEKMYLGNGALCVKDCIFFPPYLKKMNCIFSCITYDNKLHIAIKIDAALVRRKDEVQRIVDGIFKCVDVLDNEIKLKSNKKYKFE